MRSTSGSGELTSIVCQVFVSKGRISPDILISVTTGGGLSFIPGSVMYVAGGLFKMWQTSTRHPIPGLLQPADAQTWSRESRDRLNNVWHRPLPTPQGRSLSESGPTFSFLLFNFRGIFILRRNTPEKSPIPYRMPASFTRKLITLNTCWRWHVGLHHGTNMQGVCIHCMHAHTKECTH